MYNLQYVEVEDLSLSLQELTVLRLESEEQLEEVEVMKAKTKLDEVEEQIETAEERSDNSEEFIAAILEFYTKLVEKLLNLESSSRLENLRIYGVLERA